MSSVYLDANATQPLRPSAGEAFLEAAQLIGNPSSTHHQGRVARACLEQARDDIAALLGAPAVNCVFTSGGTEANALAMHGLGAGRHFFIGTTEHDAVRKNIPQGAPLTWVEVDNQGRIDCERLEEQLAHAEKPGFISLMAANNETGALHPIKDIADLAHKYDAHFHCDAVQAVGRIPLSLEALGIDSLACSGHKTGGPKGAGALLLRADMPVRIPPLFDGGGQEMGRRSGTPPLPAIAAFAQALKESLQDSRDFSPWRDLIDKKARAVGAVICGGEAPRLSNTTNLAVPGFSSQSQLMQLDLKNICISPGSACSSGTTNPSHVLQAMGLGDLAECAIRVSLPWNATREDVDYFIENYVQMVERFHNK